MRTFDDLTYEERIDAVDRAKDLLIEHVVQGVIKLKISNPMVQRKIDRILMKVRKNETPSLAKGMLIADRSINLELEKASIAAAEGSNYDVINKILM